MFGLEISSVFENKYLSIQCIPIHSDGMYLYSSATLYVQYSPIFTLTLVHFYTPPNPEGNVSVAAECSTMVTSKSLILSTYGAGQVGYGEFF